MAFWVYGVYVVYGFCRVYRVLEGFIGFLLGFIGYSKKLKRFS